MYKDKHEYNRTLCCWNCTAPGHYASECTQEKRLFCSYCLRPGVASNKCKCGIRQFNKPLPRNCILKYPDCPRAAQTLPSPFTVSVANESFQAFLDTSLNISRVGSAVANKAITYYRARRDFLMTENGIASKVTIPITFNKVTRGISCRIFESQPHILILGMDAIQCFGCQFTFGGQTIMTHPGCMHIEHQSVYDYPLLVDRREKSQRRTPFHRPQRVKNPLDLNIPEPEVSEEDIILKIGVPYVRTELEQEAWDYVTRLKESEVDDILQINVDENEKLN